MGLCLRETSVLEREHSMCVVGRRGRRTERQKQRQRDSERQRESGGGAERGEREREMGRKPDGKRLTERDTGQESKLGRGTVRV